MAMNVQVLSPFQPDYKDNDQAKDDGQTGCDDWGHETYLHVIVNGNIPDMQPVCRIVKRELWKFNDCRRPGG